MMRPYPHGVIQSRGVSLNQFDSDDYYLSTHFDVVFVRLGSRLDIWLALAQ